MRSSSMSFLFPRVWHPDIPWPRWQREAKLEIDANVVCEPCNFWAFRFKWSFLPLNAKGLSWLFLPLNVGAQLYAPTIISLLLGFFFLAGKPFLAQSSAKTSISLPHSDQAFWSNKSGAEQNALHTSCILQTWLIFTFAQVQTQVLLWSLFPCKVRFARLGCAYKLKIDGHPWDRNYENNIYSRWPNQCQCKSSYWSPQKGVFIAQ